MLLIKQETFSISFDLVKFCRSTPNMNSGLQISIQVSNQILQIPKLNSYEKFVAYTYSLYLIFGTFSFTLYNRFNSLSNRV